jgi:hypothetical protein
VAVRISHVEVVIGGTTLTYDHSDRGMPVSISAPAPDQIGTPTAPWLRVYGAERPSDPGERTLRWRVLSGRWSCARPSWASA